MKLAEANGEITLSTKYAASLKMRFPESPECVLLNSKGKQFYTSAEILGLFLKEKHSIPSENIVESEKPYAMIQTGSFSNKENAEKHVGKINLLGFEADIIEAKVNSKVYYKVVLLNIEKKDIQSTITYLKTNGFEGFPLY